MTSKFKASCRQTNGQNIDFMKSVKPIYTCLMEFPSYKSMSRFGLHFSKCDLNPYSSLQVNDSRV